MFDTDLYLYSDDEGNLDLNALVVGVQEKAEEHNRRVLFNHTEYLEGRDVDTDKLTGDQIVPLSNRLRGIDQRRYDDFIEQTRDPGNRGRRGGSGVDGGRCCRLRNRRIKPRRVSA